MQLSLYCLFQAILVLLSLFLGVLSDDKYI